jgi:cytochrome c553
MAQVRTLLLPVALAVGLIAWNVASQPVPATPELTTPAFPADDPPPAWAFSMDPPQTADFQKSPDDNLPRTVPNSMVQFTRSQVLNLFDAPDWHPDSHPPAPDIVMHGRRPRPAACAFCHMAHGMGIPENGALAGLSEAYLLQQINAYRSGSRGSARPEMVSYRGMVGIAKAMTDAEAQSAAGYYASLKGRPWIRVVETDTVPKTIVKAYTLVRDAAGGTEPIGNRIIEMPVDESRYDLRDDAAGFIAYVPVGSLKRGRALVTTGDHGRTIPCATCHGPDLRGAGDVPPIAGRGPSSLTRQLYNIQFGTRGGPEVELMKPVVAHLTAEDRVAIVAYVSSLKP